MKSNKIARTLVVGFLIGIVALIARAQADPVIPAALQLECKRVAASSSAVTNITYFQGDYITLTNSTMFADSGSTTQNLAGCVITVVAGSPGNTGVTTTVTGYTISTNAGTWGAEFICPAVNPAYIQVTVSNNFNYTYPLYRITTSAKLQ